MILFIKVINGQTVDHPVLLENLMQVFGHVPSDYLPFTKSEWPDVGVYQVHEGVTYDLIGNQCFEKHHVRDFTEAEKIQKQNQVKADWQANNGFSSWIFYAEFCAFYRLSLILMTGMFTVGTNRCLIGLLHYELFT